MTLLLPETWASIIPIMIEERRSLEQNRKEVRTSKASAPGGAYSQGIIANGFLFVSGMGPFDAVSHKVVGTTIEEQTEKTLENLGRVLEEAGLDFSDVVKATVHLQNVARDFRGFDAIYGKQFPRPLPARTTVGSELGSFLIEMDLVAALRT